MDKRIKLGFFQCCGISGSVGRVSVFGLWWCMWGMDGDLGEEGVG